ncbi:MAG: hypothetical protein U1F06_08650 [Steroidobacteraceae bacterium]
MRTAQSASLLTAQQFAHELEELHFDLTEAFAPYRQRVVFRVGCRRPAAAQVGRCAGRPPVATERGLSDATTGTTRWRVYSDWDRDQRVPRSGGRGPRAARLIAARIAWQATLPLLLGLPLLAAALVWAVARALRPVAALGREVQQAPRGDPGADPGRRRAARDPAADREPQRAARPRAP